MEVIDDLGVFRLDKRADDDRRARRARTAESRCEIHMLERRWAAVVRFRAALDQLPSGFFHRYASLAASILRSGQRPFGPPFAIFGRSDDNAVDVEAGLLMDAPIEPVDGIEVKCLPEGLVVAMTHTGRYESIGASYFELLGWMEEKSLSRDGPFMELYLDGADLRDPPERSTRIVIPVCAPARS